MTHHVTFVSNVPDLAAFEDLLVDYYGVVLKTLETAGGPRLSPKEMAAESIATIDKMLPPNGRLALATDNTGRPIGCGALLRIRPDAAEMKRMFVRPEAQGTGLGRKLFEMRLDEARAMGCTTVYADTARGNRAMLSMYEKHGFRYIDRYPENANPPELAPYLVFLECQLDGPTVA